MSETQTHSNWFLAPYCIGMKLRSLRTEKRLTLARLSAETGLSTALLSKLETDRMVPTLTTLATICRTYGVGLGHFFCDPSEHALSVTRNVVSQGRGRNAEEGARIPLNPCGAQRCIDAAVVHLAPGSHSAGTQPEPVGETLVYVLEGSMHFDVGGLRETLSTGDCAYLESSLPANWSAAGTNPCRLLTVAARTQFRGDSPLRTKDGSQPG